MFHYEKYFEFIREGEGDDHVWIIVLKPIIGEIWNWSIYVGKEFVISNQTMRICNSMKFPIMEIEVNNYNEGLTDWLLMVGA